ncbi:MAG: tripartite tricarboxylate transporter substrate binding protein [Burkholderiales bacterium]|nr:tripartite tricarboxylate transporter substrate binding protein [Burkholderiales bacterium]
MQRRSFVTFMALALAASTAPAQPSGHPIRIVVSLPAGSAIDFQARLLGPYLTQTLGQNVIVDNKPGGKDIIALTDLIKSPPDGNTLYMGSQSPLAIHVATVKNLPYDPRKDVTPIAGSSLVNHILVVKSDFPAKTFPEFIAYAKKNPGKVSLGYSTSLVQMQVFALNKQAGIDILPVPYKGTPQTITDVLGGTLTATMLDPGNALGQIKNGTMKALAVTSLKRNPLTPDIPAISETLPGYDFAAWTAMVGPPGMPKETVSKINAAMNAALKQKDVVEKLAHAATLPNVLTPDELKALIDRETDKWLKLTREAKIQPE